MNEIVIIALAGFTTGITTVLFGFGGGFVVVPFVYQLMLRQPAIAGQRHACRGGYLNGGDDI
ncbi:integral membrane protein [Klebsiella pneumoniae]|uniref:Integral membrane protein n=1 Tax=Klebsiella pneumoniae TaxID=573 RepID=A0A4P0Y959_KLEPN|nr:integral membrane protein [Klebsiella pneumoniae]